MVETLLRHAGYLSEAGPAALGIQRMRCDCNSQRTHNKIIQQVAQLAISLTFIFHCISVLSF